MKPRTRDIIALKHWTDGIKTGPHKSIKDYNRKKLKSKLKSLSVKQIVDDIDF